MKILRTLLLGAAASLAMASSPMAADIAAPYVAPAAAYGSGYGFEGFYAGLMVGGLFDGTSSYLTAPDIAATSAGVAVGVNFYLTDSIVGGVEVQASADFGSTAIVYDALALGRVGFAPADDMMVYAAAGAGVAGGTNVYAFGGGVELAAMDSLGVRGEVLGLGTWGASPNAVKATAGLIWHMQ